jgi:hypothetical protein
MFSVSLPMSDRLLSLKRMKTFILFYDEPPCCLIARIAPRKKDGLVLDLSDWEATAAGEIIGCEPIAFFTASQIVAREKGFSRKSDILSFSARLGGETGRMHLIGRDFMSSTSLAPQLLI